MIIKSDNIFTAEGCFRAGMLSVKDSKIEEIVYADIPDAILNAKDKAEILDATDMYVLPGLVDIHLHGAVGYDVCDGTLEALSAIEAYEVKNGVTTLAPATMTLPKEELLRILEALSVHIKNSPDIIAKITLEGPFLSRQKKGAQKEEFLRRPDVDLYRQLQKISSSMIGQVVVAPEEDGVFAFIEEVSEECVVSIGHTAADYQLACEAFEKGVSHVTHLFNGMNDFSHREPGILGAVCDKRNVFAEVICDGIHIHPATVRMAFQLLGKDRICMISDSMRATGMADGEYSLGGQKVFVRDGKATLSDGTIAGSVRNLYECLKWAVTTAGIPLEDAVYAGTITPAKSLKIDDRCGVLESGRCADILILDKELQIRYVIKNGEMVVSPKL